MMTNEELELTTQVVRLVINIIELQRIQNSLTEKKIEELILQTQFMSGINYSEVVKLQAKKDLTARYQVHVTPGHSVLADYEQPNWYTDRKDQIPQKFWLRYRDYLIDEKHFSPNVISVLGNETLDQKIMNCLLDPQAIYGTSKLKRGLIIGDVQSGKTSTYIGLICKAADAGYKVFILLTGTIESLRKQTQERVEEGFVGIDMSADETGGKRVGVGLDNKPICAMAMTSRVKDFTGDNDKIAVSLSANNDAVIFVIKKNTTTLQKLTKWLVTLNADPLTKKIDMPMLMIDDEADNASINTNKDKEDPTKINRLIRELANVFTKSNYVGFTATPFANVFIDPETTEGMENQDLFPEDFIISLPTPSNYIGASDLFSKTGKYYSQISYIKDAGREEADGYSFYFKHKKEWEGVLPSSLTEAIYAFYIVNAIRDLRGDKKAHRSMLVNISRFVLVQKHIKTQIEAIHNEAYHAIKFNITAKDALRNSIIKAIHNVWDKYYSFAEFTWEEICAAMFEAVEEIQIKIVNSSKNSEKLIYSNDKSTRVIAIGGLALSRGLTLEGLIVSYFYRNTSTYDVLMQMGRWFGYRKNYDDLFRIWTHKSSAEWYAEIADATNQLKQDMDLMFDCRKKPRDFGIRVRNNSQELQITAYNKMRNSTDEYEIVSYFGGKNETPYLCLNTISHKHNYKAVCGLVERCNAQGLAVNKCSVVGGKNRNIIKNVPKYEIITLLKRLQVSKYNMRFDTLQIIQFLQECVDSSIDCFDVAFMEGAGKEYSIGDISLSAVRRRCEIDSSIDRIHIGKHGRISGLNDCLVGIFDYGNKTAVEIVEKAKKEYIRDYERINGIKFEKDSVAADTWFRYVKDRRPLLMIYPIELTVDEDDPSQEKQINKLNRELEEVPLLAFLIGFPRNDDAAIQSATKYKANKIYNWFDRDEYDVGDEE